MRGFDAAADRTGPLDVRNVFPPRAGRGDCGLTGSSWALVCILTRQCREGVIVGPVLSLVGLYGPWVHPSD